jgi:hypothetical protein
MAAGRLPSAALLLIFALPEAAPTFAQEHDVDELAKQTQNPIGNVTSVPFQSNLNFKSGPFNRTQYLMNIQPVKPFHLSPDWNLIVRPIIPVLSQPVGPSDRDWGVGDIQLQSYFTPAKPGAFVWGIGPVFQFPTRTEPSLGNGLWGAGLGGVIVFNSGPWLYGALLNHVWSIGDPSPERTEFSITTIQPFINYNFGQGWALGFAPSITYDAELAGEKWTVPLGLTLTKTFVLNGQPMSLGGGAFYNVVRPDNGSDWQLRVQYTLIFPDKPKP